MRKKVQLETKDFLKWFTGLFLVLLLLCSVIVGFVYQFMANTLETEIVAMHENRVQEMNRKLEYALQECEKKASALLLEREVQLYFIAEHPEMFDGDYYEKLEHYMRIEHGSYIDSFTLYAPEYEKIYDGKRGIEGYIAERGTTEDKKEYAWIQNQVKQMDSDRTVTVRARADRWPYYITIIKHWRQSSVDGYLCVNVDLRRLYEHLVDSVTSEYEYVWFDTEGRVVINKNKSELYSKPQEAAYAEHFQEGKTYSVFQSEKDSNYVYAQATTESYGLICASVANTDDYFIGLKNIQKRYAGAVLGVAFVVIAGSVVLSVLISRPKYVEAQLKKDLRQERERLRDAQILALQTQLNPHFLFNTLNIISMTAQVGDENDKIVHMINRLSYILRYSLSSNEMVYVEEEMKCIHFYLYLMQCRYGAFEVSVEIDEQVQKCYIPKFSLQPLVENALQHGVIVRKKNEEGKLGIRILAQEYAFEEGQEIPALCIEVTDNGLGMDEKKLNEVRQNVCDYKKIMKSHIGLSNVARQFFLFFQDRQKIEIDSVFGQGTTIRILCPISYEREE